MADSILHYRILRADEMEDLGVPGCSTGRRGRDSAPYCSRWSRVGGAAFDVNGFVNKTVRNADDRIDTA